MNNIITFGVILLVAVSLSLIPPGPSPAAVTAAAEIAAGSAAASGEQRGAFTYKGQTLQYLLILPAGYGQIGRQWPLILFLHGGSGRGHNLDLVKKYGPPHIAGQQPAFPFAVLAPQCPDEETWTTKDDLLAALLDDVLTRHRLDRDRVYLTGTSMGGNGAWHLASRHPEYFAAVAPLAASPDLPTVWQKQFLTLPIWAFHGDQDAICPLAADQAMIRALRDWGAAPRFTVLAGRDHYISDVYQSRELYDWFLAHSRQP